MNGGRARPKSEMAEIKPSLGKDCRETGMMYCEKVPRMILVFVCKGASARK